MLGADGSNGGRHGGGTAFTGANIARALALLLGWVAAGFVLLLAAAGARTTMSRTAPPAPPDPRTFPAPGGRLHLMRFRYSRWDDTQDPFGPDLAAADLLEELSDDVLGGAGIEGALQRLIREGMRGRFGGLDALRDRLRRRRAQEQSALDLAGPARGGARAPRRDPRPRARDAVVPRRGRRPDARDLPRSLPPDAPGQIRELTDYRFVDPEAQRGSTS